MSQSTLVFLGLLGGVLVIFMLNPPHTPCHSQLSELTSQHTPFFILDKSSKFQEKTGYQKSFESCQESNNSGACLRLFNGVKNLVSTLEALPQDCSNLCRQKEFNEPLWKTMEVMVHIGWGDKPPETIYDRNKWLSYSDFSLFCRIKKFLTSCHNQERWKTRQEEILSKLPGTDEMERKNIWKLTLFSTNCKKGF